MNYEDWGFETDDEYLGLGTNEEHYAWLDMVYDSPEIGALPSDKAHMIFCKNKDFARIGLKALKYNVKSLLNGTLGIERLPDMAMLVDLFCEPGVPNFNFGEAIPIIIEILGKTDHEWHCDMLNIVEKICKTICKREEAPSTNILTALLKQAKSNTQLLVPWIEHVLLTSSAPLRTEMVHFCEREKVLPMLLPLTTMWRPHDYETIEYDVKFWPPACFWWWQNMYEHKAHRWFWPRLYLYHVKLLQLMSVNGGSREWFEPAFADYIMRCCLGLKGTRLSALPIARIIFFCLYHLHIDNDDLFTRILNRVTKILNVCNNSNAAAAAAGSSCKKIKC